MRIIVPAADRLLDIPIQVLDLGYVTPIDYLGGDLAIAQAAWVNETNSKGKSDPEAQRSVINYMMRGGYKVGVGPAHTSPFEHVQLKYRIKLPIFVMRQHVRHRTAHLNEFSMRYNETEADQFFVPDAKTILGQNPRNKQSRSSELSDDARSHAFSLIWRSADNAFAKYKELLNLGVAREIARVVLPVQFYTEIYWTIDLHNLFHYLKLRLHEHAQYEIRQYAQAIATFAKAVAPIAYEYFEEYVLYAKTYSRAESLEIERFVQSPE